MQDSSLFSSPPPSPISEEIKGKVLDQSVEKLKIRYGELEAERYLERVRLHEIETGKKYRNRVAVAEKWMLQDRVRSLSDVESRNYQVIMKFYHQHPKLMRGLEIKEGTVFNRLRKKSFSLDLETLEELKQNMKQIFE